MRMHVVAVAVLFALSISACRREVVAHAQDERSANRIRAILEREGAIGAEKVIVERSNPPAFDVSVEAADATRALLILDKYKLPAERGLDTCRLLAEDPGIIPTQEQSRARRACGLSGDISNKLLALEGITDVGAAVGIPEEQPLADPTEPRPKPTISVMIGYLPDENGQPPIDVDSVARFAAAVVPGMAAKDVFVHMTPAPRSFEPASAPTCTKSNVFGLLICAESRGHVASAMLAASIFSAVLAAITVIAILRALRYRRDLTRLTAKITAA